MRRLILMSVLSFLGLTFAGCGGDSGGTGGTSSPVTPEQAAADQAKMEAEIGSGGQQPQGE